MTVITRSDEPVHSRSPEASPPLPMGQGHVVVRAAGKLETDPVGFARRRRIKDMVLRFATPVVFVAAWQYASSSGAIDRRFWPSPTEILSEARTLLADGTLQERTLQTVQTLLTGYGLGAIAGIVLGLVFATVRNIRVAFEPMLTALYAIPKLAVLPLLLLVFGINDKPKIILIALTVFFVTWITTMSAVMGVATTYREAARSLDANRRQTAFHVVLPAALPEIFVALRISASMATLSVVAIEMVHGEKGLGKLIWNSWQVFFTERMYVGIVTVALMGMVFQTLVKVAAKIVCPWAADRNDGPAS